MEVTLELTETVVIELNLKSKVKTMYGKAIERQCRDLLHYFGIENARLSMKMIQERCRLSLPPGLKQRKSPYRY
jgi:citrate lyase gamma subunit